MLVARSALSVVRCVCRALRLSKPFRLLSLTLLQRCFVASPLLCVVGCGGQIDPATGEILHELEHEIRSISHPSYPVGRDLSALTPM